MNKKQNEWRIHGLRIAIILSLALVISLFIIMSDIYSGTYNGELVIWSENHVISSYEFATKKPFNEIISFFQNSSNITLTATNIIFNQTTVIRNNSGMLITNNIWYLSNMNNITIHINKDNLKIYTIKVKTLLTMYYAEILFNNSLSHSINPGFNNIKISITEYPIKTPITAVTMLSLFIIGLISQNIRLRNFEEFRITLTLLSKHRDMFIILSISLALSMILLGISLYIYDFPLMLVSGIMYLIILFVLLAILPPVFLLEIISYINYKLKNKQPRLNLKAIIIIFVVVLLVISYFLGEVLFATIILSIIFIAIYYLVFRLFFGERNFLVFIIKFLIVILFIVLILVLLRVENVVYSIALSLSFYPSYTLFSVAIQIIAIIIGGILRSSRNRIIDYRFGSVIMFVTFAIWFFVYTKTIVEPITLLPMYHYFKTEYRFIFDFLALIIFVLLISTYIMQEFKDKGITITDTFYEVSPRNNKNNSELLSIIVIDIMLFLAVFIPRYFVQFFANSSIFFILILELLFIFYLIYIIYSSYIIIELINTSASK